MGEERSKGRKLKRYRKRMWPWEGRGPWEWKVGFSDSGLGAKEREADRSWGTNGTSGLDPSDPSISPPQASSPVLRSPSRTPYQLIRLAV